MKKLISILLVMASLMQFTPVFAKSSQENSLDNTVGKLLSLDMISIETPYEITNLVTRGEFSKYLFKYLGKPIPVATASYFYDVPKTHKYVNGINYMLDCGYIKKDASGLFQPDDNLTVKDAAIIMLNVLGYGSFLNENKFDSLMSSGYSELISGVNSQDEFITVSGLVKMFDNALDVNMLAPSGELNNGNPVFSHDETFLNGYFEIYEAKGRINATSLTSLDEAIDLHGDYVAVDSVKYVVPDSMSNIVNYLGYYVKFYYKDGDDGLEILYFENNKTDELVIKAEDFVSYGDRKIRYRKDGTGSIKTATVETGANVIYNGQLLNNYTEDIFNIDHGSIELVGKGNKYDVVKIYDYTDIVVGGVVQEEKVLYSKHTTDVYRLDDYENVIIKDSYGREITLADVKADMVASIGESSGRDILIVNVSSKKVTGVLNNVLSDGDDTAWVIDGKEYEFSSCYSYNARLVGANVTVYLNYLGQIAYVVAGKSSSLMYGYLVRAYVDDDDSLTVKLFTEQGTHETFKTSDKLRIDSEKCSGEDAITLLSYEQPSSLKPSDKVQPQLIKYKINSDAEITQIDTARTVSTENADTALSKDITDLDTTYFSNIKRFVSVVEEDVNRFSNAALLTDSTKVFVVPGDAEEARTELSSYSVAGSSYFGSETRNNIDAYDLDYANGGAAGVIVVRLDSVVKIAELEIAHCLVTGMTRTLDKDDETVTAYEVCNLSTGAKSTVYDNPTLRPLENAQIEKGDIIRYGITNGTVTSGTLVVDSSANITVGVTESDKSAGNWHGYQFGSYNRLTVAKIVDMSGGFLFCSVNANSASTMKDCPLIFDISQTRCYVVDTSTTGEKVQEVEAARLRDYTCGNNEDAKAALFTSTTDLKAIVVYV